MTRSVPERVCPSCARQVPPDELACECGREFTDAGSAAGPVDASPDEPGQELFVSYLIARVEQAREALDSIRDELAGEPGDLGKAMEVMEAVQELRIARAELDQRLGRASPFADAIQDRASDEFRAEQSARAQRVVDDAGADEAAPPPFRRGRAAPRADRSHEHKRHDK